jgi:Nuclear pore complex scaffold, nucleoporins 186/192/205
MQEPLHLKAVSCQGVLICTKKLLRDLRARYSSCWVWFVTFIAERLLPAMESLERLQGLYQDLIAFSNTKLANIERLWLELDASIEDFRKLLDKRPKSNTSRESLAKGRLTLCRLVLPAN